MLHDELAASLTAGRLSSELSAHESSVGSSAPAPAARELCLLSSTAEDGMLKLVKAAMCEPVRLALRERMMGRDADDAALDLLLKALATPPRMVSLRFTQSDESAQGVDELAYDDAEADLTKWLCSRTSARFKAVRLQDLPAPHSWLNCPEARAVVCAQNTGKLSSKCSGAPAHAIIDAACGMAILRGADVFCMGVMAASAGLQEGDIVHMWVMPEGATIPTRGLVLNAAPCSPAVLIASGVSALPRTSIFTLGAKGVAIRVCERLGAAAPLAPLNDALSDASLTGKMVLQQLPSCVAVRTLGVQPGDRVMDMCAAPGGKTTHLAHLLGAGGAGLVAVDRSAARLRRVEELCRMHGFHAVRCIAADSRHLVSLQEASSENNIEDKQKKRPDVIANVCNWPPEAERAFAEAYATFGTSRFRGHKRIWKAVAAVSNGTVSRLNVQARLRELTNSHDACAGDRNSSVDGSNIAVNCAEGGARSTANGSGPRFDKSSFDRILLDPACSAMGQCPLLRWGKTLRDVQDHAAYQRHFLRTAADLLRPGGEMVYSTCTLSAEENEENVAWACTNLPLELLNARDRAFVPGRPSPLDSQHGDRFGLLGLSDCGLDEEQRAKVLRFDPRSWDCGFFVALFRRRSD
eukprot:TRINITY_DN37055_c0_g1_i1.p1 TRINITY_DN37055_c0_g1~~TRINITY_DN37055_c0_g1_i1.p1  ORF type:complete len:636 (+),score=91.34 TRINITY_DN37055_c0_g1_i1:91-1998(+)